MAFSRFHISLEEQPYSVDFSLQKGREEGWRKEKTMTPTIYFMPAFSVSL